MTVQEVAVRADKMLWLCPNIVSNQTFNKPSHLEGIECSKYYIPEDIRDREVVKSWKEDGLLCIVWRNE